MKKTNVENHSCPTRKMITIPRKMISKTCGRSQQWGLFCESNLTHHANTLDHAKCVWRHLDRVATVASRHLLPCFRPWNVCTQCCTVSRAKKVNLDQNSSRPRNSSGAWSCYTAQDFRTPHLLRGSTNTICWGFWGSLHKPANLPNLKLIFGSKPHKWTSE